MARRGNSVVGIDFGKHVFKGVVLQRKGDDRFVLTNYASREVPEDLATPDDLAQQLKLLFKDLGASTKGLCHRGFRSRIAPPNHRTAQYSNRSFAQRLETQWPHGPEPGMQGFRPRLRAAGPGERKCSGYRRIQRRRLCRSDSASNGDAKTKYLVGGMLRPTVKQISEACSKSRVSAEILQLAPVCSFNAFEFAYPDTFAKEAFLLLDMGHLQSTVMIGSRRELVLVRSIELRRQGTDSRPNR